MGILDAIGNTPLIKLSKIANVLEDVTIYAKAEYLNPSGSVKDRAASAMILDGIKSGKLTKEKTIIDATSGNTGIGYAMIGAALGYKVSVVIPANASAERKQIMKAYGADIIETSPLESSDGAYNMVQKLVKENPEKYYYPDQYNNDNNWIAHYETTGKEIWEQTNHEITHFVVGAGTSGTFMGNSRRLKEFNPDIKVIFMQPDSPFHGIEGMKHMETTIKPGILDESISDGMILVGTKDAYIMMRRLAKEEGLFVGISSGANVVAAYKVAKTLPKGSKVVTVLCDNGSRYISEPIWRDDKI